MSEPMQPATAEELQRLQEELELAAALDRDAILAEADELESFPGEDEALQALLERMEADKHRRMWNWPLGGFLGLVAAAALLILLVDWSNTPTLDANSGIPEGFALDGAGKLQTLHPTGAVSAYGAFAWNPSGSLELSACLRIWDATAAGQGQAPLEWKGITDNELPFQPGVELPAKIRWQVTISDSDGKELMRSEACSAQLQP
jgi:hypothetical protein